MPENINIPAHIKGLTEAEVLASREKYGNNREVNRSSYQWWKVLFEMLKEPMLLLLIAVSILYWMTGDNGEAVFMAIAIIVVSGISLFQDTRNHKALEELKNLNEPVSTVIREGVLRQIHTHEIVVGDMMLVAEGNVVNADATIVHSNDFTVDESSLTGESSPVYKSDDSNDVKVYSGTVVTSGLAICKVDEVGTDTRIGRMGKSMDEIGAEPTPLQLQITKFVKLMAIIGVLVFLLVCLVNFLAGHTLIDSLLKGLTLAMSVLPEEIPVAFTTFMALGSWRLIKSGIIVKKINTVEALGSVAVVCTDKTGTITENRMELRELYSFRSDRIMTSAEEWTVEAKELITTSMWASEPVPFDPMEHSLHHAYEQFTDHDDRPHYSLIHEYPLEGVPPMMTHIFRDKEGHRLIAAKGAPEAILSASGFSPAQRRVIEEKVEAFAEKGYRVLGVARSAFNGEHFPEKQQELPFVFMGLIAFLDPPKKNIHHVFKGFYDAGIAVKMVTGDNASTARAIAIQAGLPHADHLIEGSDLVALAPAFRLSAIKENTVFARMFPEAKLELINDLKTNGHIVAMTGDGVNDALALKSAHVGVAMGKRGTEIARNAAALIIADDDLSKMLDAVAMGRKIYGNLKKAIQYIISIHIPIIATVSIPLFLGWMYPNILSPVHVIFLELIMGPTCSIVYENEPLEKDAMRRPPRPFSHTFLSGDEMMASILQGSVITFGVLFIYHLSIWQGGSEEITRTMVFTTLILANIFLSLVNRSFYYPVTQSFQNGNYLMTAVVGATIVMVAIILYVPSVALFFKVEALSFHQFLKCLAASFLSVMWIEGWKWIKRRK